MNDAAVFNARADATRRFLLDRFFDRDGRTLIERESEVEMTRFGVMKHLRVREHAGLVVARKTGREKRHVLNPVPIRLIHDRWIDKYTEPHISALADLKSELESETWQSPQKPQPQARTDRRSRWKRSTRSTSKRPRSASGRRSPTPR